MPKMGCKEAGDAGVLAPSTLKRYCLPSWGLFLQQHGTQFTIPMRCSNTDRYFPFSLSLHSHQEPKPNPGSCSQAQQMGKLGWQDSPGMICILAK